MKKLLVTLLICATSAYAMENITEVINDPDVQLAKNIANLPDEIQNIV